jgi:hypothetical protein
VEQKRKQLGEHSIGHLGNHFTIRPQFSLAQRHMEQCDHRWRRMYSGACSLEHASDWVELAEHNLGDMARYFTIRAFSR